MTDLEAILERVTTEIALADTDRALEAEDANETGERPDSWDHVFEIPVDDVRRLAAEVVRLRKALEWYADPDNYDPGYEPLPCGCCSDLSKPIEADAGAVARAALEGRE